MLPSERCRNPAPSGVGGCQYYRLVDDLAAVMTEVHAALGIDSPEELHVAVADWRRRNPKGGHALGCAIATVRAELSAAAPDVVTGHCMPIIIGASRCRVPG